VNASIAWAEPDDDADESEPEEQTEDAEVEDIASRRLRRWLNGMFGGADDKQEG
jgi:hypothetical protein